MREIELLAMKLQKAGIPHDYIPDAGIAGQIGQTVYHLYYPGYDYENKHCPFICSVLQSWFCYGDSASPLEIMGLTKNGDEVEGYLTAIEVFDRIFRHWEEYRKMDRMMATIKKRQHVEGADNENAK